MNNVPALRTCLGRSTPLIFLLLFFCSSGFAQEALILRTAAPSSIESSGPRLVKQFGGGLQRVELNQSQEAMRELPISSIQKLSGERSLEIVGSSRSARDAEVYRVTAPSVVRILTNSGSGSELHPVPKTPS
jgi:hypothetical protein